MATTNAAFFYTNTTGWSNSEANMDRESARILRLPPSNRTDILSVFMLGSLIVVFQGLQALLEVTIAAKHGFMLSQGVGAIFTPLAIGSLLRLFSAPWITQDFAFQDGKDSDDHRDTAPIQMDQEERVSDNLPGDTPMQSLSRESNVDGNGRDETLERMPIKPVSENQLYWASILFRCIMVVAIAAIFVV